MSPEIPGSAPALLIDVGNTNLKWCWLQGGARSEVEKASHTRSDFATIAERHWRQRQRPGRILVSNVMGDEVEKALSGWTRDNWGLAPEFVRSVREFKGVTNAYSQPAQLGVDRWLTLIAVVNQSARPACIVDSGTATTIDEVDADGRHLGGMILPGLDLMREALLDRTRIPRIESVDPELFLARDTAHAVASAALHATAALVERVMARASTRLGGIPHLILTGSNAGRIAAVLNQPCTLEPDLVMKGLEILALESEHA